MDKLVPELYRNYGAYTNADKMLPNNIDGLLPVYRRILLGAHFVCRKKYIKTFKLLGEVMARWHPHAESAGSATWLVHNEMLEGSGQWGSRIGTITENAAATRYTKVKACDFVEELAFRYINSSSVSWEELEGDQEPLMIPTMFPLCFLFKYEMSTIAFGYKPVIPTYKLSDLKKRLFHLLNDGDPKKKLIAPNIIGCDVKIDKEELYNILTKGKGSIEVTGKHEINEKDLCIYVYGWNPKSTFQNLLNKLDKYKNWNLLTNEDVGYMDLSAGNKTVIQFHILKHRNKFEIFKNLKEALPAVLTSKSGYEVIATNKHGKTLKSSVDEMLLNAYEFFKEAYRNDLEHKLEINNKKLEELLIIEKISKYISPILDSTKDYDEIINKLSEKTEVDIESIKKVVEKYKIKKLLSFNSDKEREEIEKYNKDIKNKLADIATSVKEEYDNV